MGHRKERTGIDRWLRAFAAWWVFCAVLGLSLIGLLIWAVIVLVHHFGG